MHLFVCCIYVCVIVVSIYEAHYTQQWADPSEGGPQVAGEVARDHGFENQGQVRKEVSTLHSFLRHFGSISPTVPKPISPYVLKTDHMTWITQARLT